MFRNKIKSRDYLCVMGMHSFSIKRLRDKLDLKIFIQIEDDLKESFITKKDINKFLSENNEKDKIQIHNYIENQIKFSDLAFRFAAVNTSSVKDIKLENKNPKLKLYVKMANGFFHEELVHSLIGLCGMHIDVEYSRDLDYISLCIEGDANKEDIEQIANLLIPNLEDIVIYEPKWESGYNGLIQVITLVHISNILYQGSS